MSEIDDIRDFEQSASEVSESDDAKSAALISDEAYLPDAAQKTNRGGTQRSNRDGSSDSFISRRSLIYGGIGLVALLALGAVGRVNEANASTSGLLYPPGAQDYASFSARCIRCERCVSECPQGCISIANVGDGFFEARLPKMDFHLGYCDFCGGSPRCAEVCPTGAFHAFDEQSDKIGLAIIDRNECVAFEDPGKCNRCIGICPYDAIIQDDNGRTPLVIDSLCNGCGLCEFMCPSNSLKSYSGGIDRGIAVKTLA